MASPRCSGRVTRRNVHGRREGKGGRPSLVRTGMNMIQDAGQGAADDGKRATSAIEVASKAARPLGGFGGSDHYGWAGRRMTESALSARLKLRVRPLGP